MNVEDMTADELRALADKKDAEENKEIKKGFLKCDLYNFSSDNYVGISYERDWGDFWLSTVDEKKEIIDDFKSRFELVLKKGTKFVCYVVNGEECWFDDINYGVEMVDSVWAAKYLENIQIPLE